MTTIKSIAEHGSRGHVVSVECHISNSLPGIVIVGFAHRSVDEAHERIRGAFANSGLRLPRKRITLNLSPADIPKQGTAFDIALVAAILYRSGMATAPPDDRTILIGEVGLDGSIHPIRGIIGTILLAREQGFDQFWIPAANRAQADLIPNIKLITFRTVRELYAALNDPQRTPIDSGQLDPTSDTDTPYLSFDDISGQAGAKRALLIAASGNHHLLLRGTPGTGKSLLARALPSILPSLTTEEILEVTHRHSLADHNFDQVVSARPLRTPHHSARMATLFGGPGTDMGEIALSQHGVLVLDELPEFNRRVIESLRQPLDGYATQTARFLLLATANPCPCGFFGSQTACTCSTKQIQNYHKKLSGPILDRIDIQVESSSSTYAGLLRKANDTVHYQQLVAQARDAQYQRTGKLNGYLDNAELQLHANLTQAAQTFFDTAANKMHLSARGYLRALRVARTIADLEQQEDIQVSHLSEALQFRSEASQLTSVP